MATEKRHRTPGLKERKRQFETELLEDDDTFIPFVRERNKLGELLLSKREKL